MLILLDCRPLQLEGPDDEKSRTIISCVTTLSKEQGVGWLFLVDGSLPAAWIPVGAGHRLLTRRAFPGRRGWKLWYDWQIPSAIKKFQPDIVMTTGGITAASMRVPQCVWMGVSVDGKEPAKKKLRTVYSKRLAVTLQRAQVIFSFSEKDGVFLTGRVKDKDISGKILVVPPAADDISPLSSGEKDLLKERYTDGKEYFFVAVADAGQQEVVELLKAFSLFKKRQRSNMQLVLSGKDPASGKELAERLATYKYRADIHWAGPLSEEEGWRLAGAAYAILFPFNRDSPGTHILNGWKAGVPVITTASSFLPELAGEAVLYAQPGDPASLAAQMMVIYKDESLRNDLVGKGAKIGSSFSRERSAGIIRAGITGALNGLASKISKSTINS